MKLKLFKIAKVKRAVNYKLIFLKEIRIHSVYYISLLESEDSETSVQEHSLKIHSES